MEQRERAVRASPRRVVAVAAVAVFAGAFVSAWLAPASSAAAPSPNAAQEFSLASLGVPAQTLRGTTPSLTVSFPPPALGVAGSGGYLRVFFAHSAAAAAGSTLTVSVAGTRLDVVRLTAGTAVGSVFLARIPSALLQVAGRPTVTTFAFSLLPRPGAAAAALFGRLEADTAIHYELAAAVGTLQAHPFSLLGGLLTGSLAGVSLTVLLPAHPDPAELGDALRLVADGARLVSPASLRVAVATGGTVEALARGGSPALLVGRLAELSGAGEILRAAGFTQSGGNWRAPGGRSAGGDDGLLAAVVSPWDQVSPLVLVSGGSDAAVAKAADALLSARRTGLTGHAAVVTGAPSVTGEVPPTSLQPLPGGVAIGGDGDQVVAFGVGALSPGPLLLQLAATPAAAGGVSATVAVQLGAVVQQVVRLQGSSHSASIRAGTARAGMNGVVLDVRLAGGTGEAVHLGVSAVLSGATDTASTLDQLPAPFLADPRATTQVVLPGDDAGTIGSAAGLLGALGSLAVAPPPDLRVSTDGSHGVQLDTGAAIVLGPPRASLGVRRGLVEKLSYPAPTPPTGGAGVEELALPGGRSALWVAGDPPAVAGVAQAVAARRLTGAAALVGPGGDVRPTAPAVARTNDGAWVDRALPAAAGAMLLGPPIWAWWAGRLRRTASLAAAGVAVAGVAWTGAAIAAGVPPLLVLAVAAAALCLAVALTMGRTSALIAAGSGLSLAVPLLLAEETRPAWLAVGGAPAADAGAVALAVGWRWAVVAALAAGLLLIALVGEGVRRRLQVRGPATATFVMVGVDADAEAAAAAVPGDGASRSALADVLDEQGLPPGVELVGRRWDDARHEDQVLLAFGGTDSRRARDVIGQVESAVRRRLGRRPHSQVVVLEQPSAGTAGDEARVVDVVARFERRTNEVPWART